MDELKLNGEWVNVEISSDDEKSVWEHKGYQNYMCNITLLLHEGFPRSNVSICFTQHICVCMVQWANVTIIFNMKLSWTASNVI